jgi:predicted acetyltransferase
VRLRPLTVEDEAAALAAHEELGDFGLLLNWEPGMSWDAFLTADPPPGWVPGTFLVAEADGEIVGRVSVRFALNDWLRNYGGHIGYAVRPAFRRRGYATEMLRQSLEIARANGVGDVLITCDDDNETSRTIIERAGGVPDTPGELNGKTILRFWIRGEPGSGR